VTIQNQNILNAIQEMDITEDKKIKLINNHDSELSKRLVSNHDVSTSKHCKHNFDIFNERSCIKVLTTLTNYKKCVICDNNIHDNESCYEFNNMSKINLCSNCHNIRISLTHDVHNNKYIINKNIYDIVDDTYYIVIDYELIEHFHQDNNCKCNNVSGITTRQTHFTVIFPLYIYFNMKYFDDKYLINLECKYLNLYKFVANGNNFAGNHKSSCIYRTYFKFMSVMCKKYELCEKLLEPKYINYRHRMFYNNDGLYVNKLMNYTNPPWNKNI
jgi:hypothetical protein